MTIVGGVFILIGGAALAAIASIFGSFLGGYAGLFYIGLVVGLLTIIMGVLMFAMPQNKLIWGVLAIVFAILSIPFALGGILIGFILTLIGGILAIVYKAPAPPPPMMMPPMGMVPPPPPH